MGRVYWKGHEKKVQYSGSGFLGRVFADSSMGKMPGLNSQHEFLVLFCINIYMVLHIKMKARINNQIHTNL